MKNKIGFADIWNYCLQGFSLLIYTKAEKAEFEHIRTKEDHWNPYFYSFTLFKAFAFGHDDFICQPGKPLETVEYRKIILEKNGKKNLFFIDTEYERGCFTDEFNKSMKR